MMIVRGEIVLRFSCTKYALLLSSHCLLNGVLGKAPV